MSGAVILRRQNRYMELFNKLGAVDPENSISIEEHGIRRSYIFRRMVDRGIFIECEKGWFYIDNQAAERFRVHRRFMAMAALAVMLVVLAIYFLAGGR